ncbi:hypothetical protein [Streptomyces sp. NPDC004134]|uniref:hypothetical protein n=1 Tax=Streptomyces sp. NPDC004134 TaxID=3364691 RepID=UPI0036A70015
MAGKLHVHFNDRDFRHVQLARTADPIWEAILGLHVAYTPAPRLPARLRPWHRRARHRLRQHDLRRTCRFVNGIAPADARYFPDFLTPAESEDGITAALRTLRATPATRLAREIRLAARHRPLPPGPAASPQATAPYSPTSPTPYTTSTTTSSPPTGAK